MKTMKKIFLTIAIAVLGIATAASQSGESIYKKYSDCAGVDAVYISPAMFRIMGTLPDADTDVDFGKLLKTMKGMYILDTENLEVGAAIRKDVERMVEKKEFELLMEAKSDGETVFFYTAGTADTVTCLLMLAVEPDEVSFLSLEGKMDRAELEAALANEM